MWVIVLGDLTGEPVDDEFDLLREPQGPTPPERRPAWLLVGGLIAVVLLTLVGVVWMVSSVSGRGGTVTAAATTAAATTPAANTAAPAVTAAPTTTLAATTEPPVPTTTVPLPTATFTVPTAPPPSAVTVAPTRKPAPTTSRPAPKPTASAPVGKLVPVPGVIGLRVRAATQVLRAQGFKVQVLGGLLSPDRDDRRVTAQRPTPGSVVRAGSTVILVTDGL